MGALAGFPDQFLLTRGVSDVAEYVGETMGAVLTRFLETATGEQGLDILDRLETARQEHAAENTDGYGCSAMDPDAFERAWRLAEALPAGFPEPEVVVEPDGDVALEWSSGPQRILVASLDPDDVIRYAGMFGTSSTDGREYFDGRLPRELSRLVTRVYDPAV